MPAAVKAEFVRRLAAAGLPMVETTSFVDPRWVPQLADAEELLGLLGDEGRGPRRPVLVPNERGLERALATGVGAVAVFGSATETFARKNLNRTVAESVEMFRPVVERSRAEGLWVRAYVSMCFGDPWEGPVPVAQVVDVCRRLMDLGCDQLSLGDTIGVGTVGHVHRLLAALDAAGIGPDRVGVHFHDTYGQALANTMAALRDGVRVVDASTGGLGGCPYARVGDRQPRDRGPGLGAAGRRCADRHRPRRAGRDQRVDGRPPRPAVAVERGARPLRRLTRGRRGGPSRREPGAPSCELRVSSGQRGAFCAGAADHGPMSDQNPPVPGPADPEQPPTAAPDETAALPQADAAAPAAAGGHGDAAAPAGRRLDGGTGRRRPGAPRLDADRTLGATPLVDEATSTGGGRAALLGVAVLAGLFVLAGVALSAALVVGHHRGDDDGFLTSNRGWMGQDEQMGPGNGNGKGQGQGNGQGQGQGKPGQRQEQGSGQPHRQAAGRPGRRTRPPPASRAWAAAPVPRRERCCTVSSRPTSPARRPSWSCRPAR